MLARVVYATDQKVLMSLPGRMKGQVIGCSISEPYNKLLADFVDDKIDNVTSLSSMFRSGQYVAVRVLQKLTHGLNLSMMPQHVNMIKHTDMNKGVLLQAAVSSIEDHGYVMDVGIPLTTAFMPTTNTNEEITLDVGSITWCVVKSVTLSANNTLISLSNKLQSIQNAVVTREPGGSYTNLLPGTAVNFVVDKALDSGIEGHIFQNTISYIQRTHADTVKGKKPTLGQKIRPRLLYVMPTRKTPYFSLKNIFETTYPDLNEERKLQVGEVVEKAQVIKISGRTIILKLAKKCLGSLGKKRIAVDENLSDEEVLNRFYPIGSEHKVRVLTYNMLDYMYSVTDEENLLNEQYFSYSDLSIGDFVTGTVQSVLDTKLLISVGRLSGVVHISHTSDVGVVEDSKKTSTISKKKFKEGQSVKARVLLLTPEKSYMVLTMKPSLLAEDLVVLKDIQDVEVNHTYTGFITHISNYILVSFFNNLKAYVDRNNVSVDPIDNLSEAFHLGQIVNVRIYNILHDQGKIFGSFISLEEWLRRNNKGRSVMPEREIGKKRKLSETNTSDKGKKKKAEIFEQTIFEPEDEKLINLDSCITVKDLKERSANLENLIFETTEKKERVVHKIQNIENKGLTPQNKMRHTAMHAEKLMLEERLLTFNETLNKVQEKIAELPKEEKTKWKKKDKKEKIVENGFGGDTREIKVADNAGPVLELPSVQDFWTMNADELCGKVKDRDQGKEDDLSSDDEATIVPKKKRKKLTVEEKVNKAREEEERLRELELRAIESESAPKSSDHFERALLGNPNNSEMWIAYMAFHLQATEIDKARAIGKKALKTICFREEGEKLNVWLALINIEYRFGTKDTQQKTLSDALQANDKFKVHSKLLDIYVDTGNTEELSPLVELMMRKYRRDPQTYVLCGTACYKAKMIDKARYVMQKAVSLLEKKEHVSVIVQFALLERTHGERERAEALFEQILTAFPQRVDVCSTYVDMLYKNKDIEAIRQLMERMTSQKLPARKMKVVYKKWIETEEKAGNTEEVEVIRQKVMEYIQKAQF